MAPWAVGFTGPVVAVQLIGVALSGAVIVQVVAPVGALAPPVKTVLKVTLPPKVAVSGVMALKVAELMAITTVMALEVMVV